MCNYTSRDVEDQYQYRKSADFHNKEKQTDRVLQSSLSETGHDGVRSIYKPNEEKYKKRQQDHSKTAVKVINHFND